MTETEQAMVEQLAETDLGASFALQRVLRQVDALQQAVTMQTREIARLKRLERNYDELKKRVDEAGKWAGKADDRIKNIEKGSVNSLEHTTAKGNN